MGNISYVLGATLSGITEQILAPEAGVEVISGIGAGAIPTPLNERSARRLTITCQNKSTTQTVTFRVEVCPGQKDPDTDEYLFVGTDFTGYTVDVAAAEIELLDIAVYHPYLRIRAIAAVVDSNPHRVLAYVDAYQDARG